MALEAYLDETGRETGVFGVVAYVFEDEQARAFDTEWRNLFGNLLPFHMADLVHPRKHFDGIERGDADELIKEAVQIINRHVMAGAAVSCNVNDVADIAPDGAGELSHPYSVCAHFCLGRVGQWLRDSKDTRDVAYMLEAGHRHMSQANRFFRVVTQFEAYRLMYQYRSHAFLPKADATPLQAADLFAWEWGKYYDETHLQDIRPMRKSLATLVGNRLDDYRFMMLKRKELREFYDGLRKAEDLTVNEAADLLGLTPDTSSEEE